MAALHQIVNLGRASGIQTLRPFPAVACHLMKLVDGATKVDFGEVSRVLMADAAFSSQVLRVANSALFGARYEVASILQALCVVGDLVPGAKQCRVRGGRQHSASPVCCRRRSVTRPGGYGSFERLCG